MVTLTNLPLEECRMEGRYLLLKHGRRFQNQQRERSRKFPTESTSPHSLTAARPNCRPKNSKCPKADFTSQQLVRETFKSLHKTFFLKASKSLHKFYRSFSRLGHFYKSTQRSFRRLHNHFKGHSQDNCSKSPLSQPECLQESGRLAPGF